MSKEQAIKDLSLEICQYLLPVAYQKDTPPLTRAEDIARYLINQGYVKVRKGDIYWTREQLSAPDYAGEYYKE